MSGFWSSLFPGTEGELADLWFRDTSSNYGWVWTETSIEGTDGEDIYYCVAKWFKFNPYKTNIYLKGGNDAIEFGGTSSSNTVDLGEGDQNVFKTTASVRYSDLIGGSGSDLFLFQQGGWEQDNMFRSSIEAGGGSDLIILEKDETGLTKNDPSVIGSMINTGSGDDRAWIKGFGLTFGAYEDNYSSIYLGEGDDKLFFIQSDVIADPISVSNLLVDAGDGDDEVNLSSTNPSKFNEFRLEGGKGFDILTIPDDISLEGVSASGFEKIISGDKFVILNNKPVDILISTSTFDENIASGSAVATLSTTDPDADNSHAYSLVSGTGDTDNISFSIEGNQLKIINSPNFETKSSYNIRLQTKDSGDLTFEKAFTLKVNDIKEILTSEIAAQLIAEQGDNVIIPNIYDSIAGDAFYNKQLTSVVIPNIVTSIGWGAFIGTQLRSVDIGNSVISIGFRAFAYNRLNSVAIPNSVASIGEKAFYKNQLTSVDIGSSVTSIGDNAFSYNSLTRALIPNSVTSIGNHAFYKNQLTSVDIGDNAVSIGDGAFQDNQLTSLAVPNNVTTIGDYAFYYNQLAGISIGDGVTSLGENAFAYNKLTSVVVPDGVTWIKSNAFSHNQLTSVVIGNNVTWIDSSAFSDNQLTSIAIPDSVTSIGGAAFYGNQLTSIVIPDNVLLVGSGAFDRNPLQTVSISADAPFPTSVFPEGVLIDYRGVDQSPTDISSSSSTFDENIAGGSVVATLSTADPDLGETHTYSLVTGSGDTDNSEFTIDGDQLKIINSPNFESKSSYSIRLRSKGSDGLTFEKAFTLKVNDIEEILTSEIAAQLIADQGTDIVIPNIYTTIQLSAFSGKHLTSVVIPSSVTEIQASAFSGNQLTSVDIGSSVTKIGGWAFRGNQLTNIKIPDSVAWISYGAFQDNQLKSVVIPDGVTWIGVDAFSGNPLESVSISKNASFSASDFPQGALIDRRDVDQNPENIFISSSTFDENIAGGSAVATLGSTDPDVGDTHTYTLITGTGDTDNGAFTIDGDQLKIVDSPDFETKSSYSIRLQTKDSGGLTFEKAFTLTVNNLDDSAEILTSEIANQLIAEQGTDIVIPNIYTLIGASVFHNKKLTSIVIPSSVTSIERSAFSDNELTSVSIPESITTIEESTFQNNKLTSIAIPASVTSIERSAFNNNRLTSVILPNSVTSIGDWAFYYNQLTDFAIPKSVTSIGSYAFNVNQLTNIVIPDSVTSIGVNAFAINKLTSITIPDSVSTIGIGAFSDNQLTSIGIGNGVASIGVNAFAINKLTSITIPDSVSTIGIGAFSDNQLTSIGIGNGVASIGVNAFAINKLTSITIPDSVSSIGDGAFHDNPLEFVSIAADAPFPTSVFPEGVLIDYRGVDQSPTDISSSSSSFDENLEGGSSVATLSSIDPDAGDTHTYSLVTGDGDTDNSAFIIDGDQLKIIDLPDFETKSSYSIRVQTKDSGDLTFEKEFILDVSDLNEVPTNLSVSTSTFDEGIPGGSAIATLSSTDPDAGDTHTYSLVTGDGDTDNSAFTIDGDQLKIVDSPDFETKSSYSIRVQTKDSGDLTFEKEFTLDVNDQNDAPINLSVSTSTFDENIPGGSSVATLSSIDPDAGDTHTYSLVIGDGDTDNSAFTIDGDQLKIIDSPDFENKFIYSIRLQTKDSGNLTFAKSVILTVNDLDEGPAPISLDDITTQDEISTFDLIEPIPVDDQFIESVIIGTQNKDKITGTSDGEVLAGQEGKDVLRGGGGPDGFFFQNPAGFSRKEVDIIKDFHSTDFDLVLVDQKFFGPIDEVALKAVSNKRAIRRASKTNHNFVYDNKKGLLYFNENGSNKGWGDGGLFAKLQGVPELGASDFMIV